MSGGGDAARPGTMKRRRQLAISADPIRRCFIASSPTWKISGHLRGIELEEFRRHHIGLAQIDVDIADMECAMSISTPEESHNRPGAAGPDHMPVQLCLRQPRELRHDLLLGAVSDFLKIAFLEFF